MPRVSVVIPTYNCAHYLGQAIDSVLGQSYTDLEVIVVDDGSRDNTAEVAAAYGPRIRYMRQENSGLPAARNRAIEAAGGELIALLDADDWWEPNKLQAQVEMIDADGEVALVYTDLRVIYDDGRVIPSFLASRPLASDGYVFPQLVQSGFILPSTVVLRKRCVQDVGMFDETMRSHEDIDLWLRLCHRWKVRSVREPLVNRRQGAQNMTSNAALRTEYGVTTFQKALGIAGLTTAERDLLQVRLEREHFELAYYLCRQGQGASCREHLRKSLHGGRWNRRALKCYVLSLLPAGVASKVRRSVPALPGG